jgi:iron complex transport system permease protein
MKPKTSLFFILLASLLALLISPLFGHIRLSPQALTDFSQTSQEGFIFWNIRLPRTLLCWITGAALAIGGMAFQALFRNDLSTPFTLGVSGGAACGVALLTVIELPLLAGLGMALQPLGAFLGSLIAIAFIMGFHALRPRSNMSDLLLAGVALSFIFNSLILFMQYMANPDKIARMIHWMMGGMQIVGYQQLLFIGPIVLIACIIIFRLIPALDLLSTGDDLASTRGLNVRRTQKLIFLAVSLMCAGVVSLCGPIGFVGLVAPHICRRLLGPSHRYLFWACLFFGGGFLCICDLLCRVLPSSGELPLGVLTALTGTPFFIYLLAKRK